jgi:hypothetical protein
MKRTMVIVAAVVLTVFTPSTLVAWGPEGHEIVASLAQSRLSGKAKRGIRSLVGSANLASIANWADEVRSERDESFNWHFANIPKDASGFSEQRDCFIPNNRHKGAATDHHNCVVDRIEIFEHVLADRNAPREDRIEALKFLVHFVGDVHQPFHGIGDAAGGNGIAITEFGSTECGQHPCNLHGSWDIALIHFSKPTCPLGPWATPPLRPAGCRLRWQEHTYKSTPDSLQDATATERAYPLFLKTRTAT